MSRGWDPLGVLRVFVFLMREICFLLLPVNRWAASVAIAREFDRMPPTTSPTMNTKHRTLANSNRLRALQN